LEDRLGFALFVREGRRLRLTAKGERLAVRVQAALDYLTTEIAALAEDGTSRSVAIAASASVSHLWLSPRLRGFGDAHPDVPIRLLTTDALAELASEAHDLTILYSRGAAPGWSLSLLLPEELVPVASPAYLARKGLVEQGVDLSAAEIAALDLYDYRRANAYWVSLRGWFLAKAPELGSVRPRMIFSTYAMAVEAALRGDGVVLGSRHMLAETLASGALVEVSRDVLTSGFGYYLGVPTDRVISPAAHALADYLRLRTG
ncbi:MAG: LysR substrate-binding domain-containing protein, partial [Pseudomonadota bacterium]